ncbi:hypothetical protein MUO79_10060 [Candidatus Bathyarchaeota archaeon]|nr:hypothetical protein [Candidatus Bathyarchaeota archaeon]
MAKKSKPIAKEPAATIKSSINPKMKEAPAIRPNVSFSSEQKILQRRGT